MPVILIHYIQTNTDLPLKSITNTLELLAEDCTIPFISRYRKERTGNLDEVEIANIKKFKQEFEGLEKRKKAILKALEEQGVTSAELLAKIESCTDSSMLEDLYLPYKKKRLTKAEIARKQGLEPLAKMIMSQRGHINISKFLSSEISSEEAAFEGARFIIAEWINERTGIRNAIRNQLNRHAIINAGVIKSKAQEDNAQKYRDYFDFSEALNRCPSHRLLAMLRGEKEGFIRLKIQIDNDRAIANITDRVLRHTSPYSSHIEKAIQDAYKRLLFPSLSNERMALARQKADVAAIEVFSKNLKQLLLAPPLGEKAILAIDPGFRTGCKVVCLGKQGELLYNETIYPHAPKNDKKGAMKKLSSLVNAYRIDAIAIGNGTASRETEQLIRHIRFAQDIEVFVVSEAGASIYSASKIAREEFPNYDVTVRGAVSIGRRLADPLAELVKIDAKSIGVGQYQHDVDQTLLKNELDTVVELSVNAVGVNINTASASLLSFVSGIGSKLAASIVSHRNENGSFKSRQAIKEVPRLGQKAFEQSAGFLRIHNGENPLDNSSVHPESYGIVKKIANDEQTTVADLIGNSKHLKNLDLKKYCTENTGLLTLTDIVKELEKPGLDPREKATVFTFNKDIKSINDLRPGQRLPGIVNNITNFGCFVDLGIKESGLIHISNLSDTFVSDINAVIHLHEHIIVEVLEVDLSRKRIQLRLDKKINS